MIEKKEAYSGKSFTIILSDEVTHINFRGNGAQNNKSNQTQIEE